MIIAIVGCAGSGKDTMARMMGEMGCNVICSYTTRPKREGEIDDREHHFVTAVPPKDTMLAYTIYGGYEYWTCKNQVIPRHINVYVIDEQGLEELREKIQCRIVSVHISASEDIRRARGVTDERMQRDNSRKSISGYDVVIENNGSLDELRKHTEELIVGLINDER